MSSFVEASQPMPYSALCTHYVMKGDFAVLVHNEIFLFKESANSFDSSKKGGKKKKRKKKKKNKKKKKVKTN